jgi:probable F420-dependent oxidoreductase
MLPMKLDGQIAPYTTLGDIPAIAQAAEQFGFDCLWAAETQHNPFLPGVLIAEHTQKLKFGTAIAVSFARSPAVMAHTAWDLAQYSQGRFILGLGTQVKAHITRRFGLPWPDSVVGKLREQVGVMRAFWRNWQDGDKLGFEGKYYTINLTSPFFIPAGHEFPEVPIFIAGVNTGLAQLTGEVAQGFHAHPFHSRSYLKEIIRPAIETGARKTGRSLHDLQVVANAFVVTSPEEREMVRQQIGFYASTPSYRAVMSHHGWQEVGEALSKLVRSGQWGEISNLVSDEMVDTFATTAHPAELADALKERYQGVADRINLYIPFTPGERDDFWLMICRAFNQ